MGDKLLIFHGGDLKPAVVYSVEVQEVKCLEQRVEKLRAAESLLTLHPHSHTNNNRKSLIAGNEKFKEKDMNEQDEGNPCPDV